ncbi:MAG: GNAT family N-acetyltransferase, partial [Planctomycetia bacterium]|nr:GNAT family N-acetyltransferase [Planctomycetia bacterium]
GRPLGTTATCVFGPVAWVAMVLVDEAHRGRGIGQALMRHALLHLDRLGVRSVRLDATPLGQPLYEKLGFRSQFSLTRFAGTAGVGGNLDESVSTATAAQRDEIFALDERVTRTDRRKFLAALFDENPQWLRVTECDGTLEGYCTRRSGALATQLGPCIAAGDAGRSLLSDALRQVAGQPVFVDIPQSHAAATAWAQAAGLVPQRTLVRMCRGAELREREESLWASSGPELG